MRNAAAAGSMVLVRLNPMPTAATATTSARRDGPHGRPAQPRSASQPAWSTSGASTMPATSDSLPVRSPGHAALRAWSFTISSASAASVTGCSRLSAGTARGWDGSS